jgi:hypothetical protein
MCGRGICEKIPVLRHDKYDFANNMKKFNLMQIHLHEVKILQIHNARPEFVKQISHQSESSIHSTREICRLSTGIFRKYPSQT